jgi:phytoene desaturase
MAKTEPLNQRAVIIGAGIGGLSAAIRLAAAGWQVTIVEKNAQVGGKMSEITEDGFRWDTGPSVITMRHVLEDLFAAAGRRLTDYLTLLPVEPLARYFYPDGKVLDVTADLSEMANRISAFEPHDVEGYLAYLAYAARIHRITGPIFIYDQPPTLRSFARVPLHEWLRADPLRTMDRAIRAHVRSPHLRQLLGRFATYVGGSPYEAPATLNVIAHVELVGGVWYPQGGIYAIARALRQLAEELGVDICTGQPVQRINVQAGHATGVTLGDGSVIRAQAVVANVDVTTVYERLLPDVPSAPRRAARLKSYEPSCSGFILLLGVEGISENLAHHNVFFSNDYRQEFDFIFKKRLPAPDPTIYVSITSKSDPSHAPSGHENWFVLVNAPALSDRYDWATHAQAYRDVVLERLATVYGLDVRSRIVTERILTPVDLEAMSGAYRGALYGASANSKWTAFRRPHNRCTEVKGLYFAGGTTHPGGGVPMVMLSGKVAAELLLHDMQG